MVVRGKSSISASLYQSISLQGHNTSQAVPLQETNFLPCLSNNPITFGAIRTKSVLTALLLALNLHQPTQSGSENLNNAETVSVTQNTERLDSFYSNKKAASLPTTAITSPISTDNNTIDSAQIDPPSNAIPPLIAKTRERLPAITLNTPTKLPLLSTRVTIPGLDSLNAHGFWVIKDRTYAKVN